MRWRLTGKLTDAVLRRMAVLPSTRAPFPAELLQPSPFALRLPEMDPEERRLLDAVLADPDADEPRLRFADGCDRVGDPRGAFIRGQIGSTSVTRESDEFHPSQSTGHSNECRSPQHLFAPWGAKDLVFRRGFVEGMSLSGRSFISLGASLFRLTPLREVRLVAIAPYIGELAACPHLARLRLLDLSGNGIGAAEMRLLQDSPHLAGQREPLVIRNDNYGLARSGSA